MGHGRNPLNPEYPEQVRLFPRMPAGRHPTPPGPGDCEGGRKTSCATLMDDEEMPSSAKPHSVAMRY
ncbi:hypothetical protein E4U28_004168 [Claviceps purpurea]|nr:hypothetical protein E4U28_004168 [Claviceps purpurea]